MNQKFNLKANNFIKKYAQVFVSDNYGTAS